MTDRPMKTPSDDHQIAIARSPSRVVVRLAGRVIADTVEALTFREASYRPVQYIPRKDVDMALLERTSHVTHCPYKGEATYFSIPLGGTRATNAAWSYEAPYPVVAQIKSHIAFYPDRVDCVDEWEQTDRDAAAGVHNA